MSTRPALIALTLGIALLGLGCTGAIGSTTGTGTGTAGTTGIGTGTGGTGTTGTAGATGAAGSSVTGVAGNPATGAGGTVVVAPPDPAAAGPLPLRRLTSREYLNTVRDLLTDTTSVAGGRRPWRGGRHQQQRVPVSPADVDRHGGRRATCSSRPRLLAKNVATRLSTILPCTPANAAAEAGCASQFITTFGLKAFRRPLSTTEVTDLTALYQTARTTLALDFNGAIGVLVEAMLQSPGLPLSLGDRSPARRSGTARSSSSATTRSPAACRITCGARCPTRRCSPPPRRDSWRRADGIETQAQRMLADAKAQNMVADFVEDLAGRQHHRRCGPRIPAIYSMWSPDLVTAMGTEVRSFATSTILGSGPFGRPVHQHDVVRQPGAGAHLRRHRRHRDDAQGGDVRRHPARGDPDARRLPGRQRRQRRIVAGAARPRGADAADVRDGPRPARQRPAARSRRRPG